ncbi:MAG: MBL fold metallo-hydrolase [Myxococcales bacterium]|nr:MAG: MBL fold metallo-hydrolase [Myxococcales bacterium]
MSMDEAKLTTIDGDYVMPGLAATYLRVQGDEAAFIETCTSQSVPQMLAALAEAGLTPGQVRWVIVTHVHLDHAGGASALMQACPQAQLLAHPRAARHLIDPSRLVASARQVYGAEKFDRLYGAIEPIAAERVKTMEDGQEVQLGDAHLQFLHTRGHANHHFVVVDHARSTVFTGDTFGLVYPRLQRAGRLAYPSTSPTDFDVEAAHASIDRIVSLNMNSACLTHFGEIRDLDVVGGQLHRWLDLSERLVSQAAAAGGDAAAMEARIRPELDRAMEQAAAEAGLALDADDRKLIAFDLALNAQGLAFAAHKQASGAGA